MHMLRDVGPPTGQLLPLVTAMAAAGAFLLAGVQLAKVRVPSALQLLAPGAVLAVGVLGTVWSIGRGEAALAHASPEMRTTLVASGMQVALYSSILAGWLTAGLALFAAVVHAVGRVARAGPGRWSPLAAVPVALGLGGGVALAAWAGLGSGAVAALGGLAVGIAAVREPEGEEDAARVVPVRLGVAGIAGAGALCLAWANAAFVRAGALGALALAVPEARASLVAQVAEEASAAIAGPLLAAALVLLTALVLVAPRRAALRTRRTAVHALLFALVPLGPLALAGYERARVASLVELARPYAVSRLEALSELGIALAPSTARKPAREQATLTVSPDAVWIDGTLVGEEVREGLVWPVFAALDAEAARQGDLGARTGQADGFEGTLQVEADAEVRMARLAPLLDTAVGARFRTVELAVRGEQGVATIGFELVGEAHPKAGTHDPRALAGEERSGDRFVTLVIRRAGPRVHPDHDTGVGPLRLSVDGERGTVGGLDLADTPVAEPGALTAHLAEAKDRWPDEERLLVEPSGATTVAELVVWLDAARVDPTAVDAGSPRLLFPGAVLLTGPLPPPEPD